MKQSTRVGDIVAIVTLIMILAFAVVMGMYAWARYTSQESSDATATIAKWNFDMKLKNGDQEATVGPIDLADTAGATHVKTGTIAPGTSGQFQILVDTSGTETDMVYDVTIGVVNCPKNITFTRIDESTTSTVLSEGGSSNELSRTLQFSQYLAKNQHSNVHTETIAWNWPYDLTSIDANAESADIIAWDQQDKDDNGRNVTFTINVKGTEVLSDTTAQQGGENSGNGGNSGNNQEQENLPDNSVKKLAQAGTLQRWDKIDYTPASHTINSYIEYYEDEAWVNASIYGDMSTTDATDWVVIDITDDNDVLIAPRNMGTNHPSLHLSMTNGYNHGAEIMDNLCALYLNSNYATEARSITIEEVNKIEGVNPSVSGGTGTMNTGYYLDENGLIQHGAVTNRTFSDTSYEYNSKYFRDNNDGYDFWTTARAVSATDGYVSFGYECVTNNHIYYRSVTEMDGDWLGDDEKQFGILPVVTLKADLLLQDSGTPYIGFGMKDVAPSGYSASTHKVWNIVTE